MALTLELAVGSDLTLHTENLVIVRKFHVHGTLPYTGGGDAFDFVSSAVIGLIRSDYPTYSTSMGTLYWNSIQLHENFYAQSYDVSVTYSPLNKQSGAYQIIVDQAVGNVHVTAGTRIAGYPVATCPNNEGTFFDGPEVTGCYVPVAEDRFSVMYRHPRAWLNHAYIRSIGRLRGYPCSDTFLGYQIGEVRYMGGSFTESDCEATAAYNFEYSPNVTNLVVAGITIASKYGFDVISPIYKTTTDVVGAATHPSRQVEFIEIIRPREHKAYRSTFGWG